MKKIKPRLDSLEVPIASAVAEVSRLLVNWNYSMDEAVALLRARMIINAMKAHGGNVCKAASALRVHRNTVTRDIVEFRLQERVTEIRESRRPRRTGARIAS